MKCKRCKKTIKKIDKAVLWKTFEGKKIYEEVYWHWKCFIEWRNESLENRAKKIYQKSMQNCIPKFSKMLGGILNNDGKTKEINLQEMGFG